MDETAPSTTVDLEAWSGLWPDDDPDANFKHDVALYSRLDPLSTLTNLSAVVDIPVGSLCRYILAKWASAGAEALLALGPTAVERLWRTVTDAEAEGTEAARLAAFEDLSRQLAWLRIPLGDSD
jgi:hypothetical protein